MIVTNHEYYVDLKVAKLLRDAGFDWECRKIYYCYHEDGDTWELEDNDFKNHQRILELDYCLLAPTIDATQRWLREVKNCYISIDVDYDSKGVFYTVKYIFHDGNKNRDSYIWEDTGLDIVKHHRVFENYEEAQEADIEKLLEHILENEQ